MMPLTDTSRKPVAVAQGRDLGDEYLIYDRPRDQVHVLNGTARKILLLCDGVHTAEQIAAALAETYGIDEATARDDTKRTLRELSELGALDWN